MMKRIPKPVRVALKIALAVIPFIWIFGRVDLNRIVPAVLEVKWWTVPALFAAVVTAMLLQGVRWWLLLKAFSSELTLGAAMGCHFRAIYYSLLLPTSTAQEVVRTVLMAKKIGQVTSWSAAWVGKITGTVISIGLSMYGLTVLSKSVNAGYVNKIILASVAVAAVVICLSFSKRFTRPVRGIVSRFIPARTVGKVERLREGIYLYRHKKSYLFWSCCISLFAQILIFGTAPMMIAGITGSPYIFECMAFVPLIEMISMAQPLTPNGIGVRDALFAMMFKVLRLSNEQLLIYSAVSNLSIVMKLLGAVPIIRESIRKRRKIV